MDDLDIITLAEAGELLDRSASTLRHQVKAGRLRARLIGKTWITTRAEVERYRAESLGQVGRPRITSVTHPVPRITSVTHIDD